MRCCWRSFSWKFLGTNFNLRQRGDENGTEWGVDCKILEPGDDHNKELKFKVNISKQNSDKNRKLENYLQNGFNYNDFKAYISNCSWSVFDNKLPSVIDENSEYYNQFVDGFIKTIFDGVNNAKYKDKGIKEFDNNSVWYGKGSNIKIISSDEINKGNINWKEGIPFYSYNNVLLTQLDKTRINSSDPSIPTKYKYEDTNNNCDPTNELLNQINIQSFIDNNKESLVPIINFNGYPLFMVNDKLGIKINGYDGHLFRYNKYDNPIINVINKDDKDGDKSLISTEQAIKYLSDKNQYFDKLTDNLINVSQNYQVNKNEDNSELITFNTQLINNSEKLLDSELYYDQNYNLKFKDESVNQNLEPASLLGQEIKWSFANMIASYNKTMNNIIKKYKNIPSYTLSKLVDPSEILFLKGKNGNVLKFNYGEVLSRLDDINVSVINNSNLKIFYDQAKLQEAIKNSTLTDPAKVVVLYDLMGNVINPGVKLSSTEELLTTSDAIYDSESTIMDNILRTKVIKNDPTKTFYLENDGETYTLLDNQSNLIYNLYIDGKNYQFITYQDAWWYYYDFIKLNSIKVVK